MSSRGSFAKNGHVTTNEYKTIKVTSSGTKILEGYGTNHSLPDYAHTPGSIYVKLKKDKKTLHEMRFYDDKGFPIIEIAYHPEPKINNGDRRNSIVHYHTFDGIDHNSVPHRMNEHPEVKEKYKLFLEEYELYDKC